MFQPKEGMECITATHTPPQKTREGRQRKEWGIQERERTTQRRGEEGETASRHPKGVEGRPTPSRERWREGRPPPKGKGQAAATHKRGERGKASTQGRARAMYPANLPQITPESHFSGLPPSHLQRPSTASVKCSPEVKLIRKWARAHSPRMYRILVCLRAKVVRQPGLRLIIWSIHVLTVNDLFFRIVIKKPSR